MNRKGPAVRRPGHDMVHSFLRGHLQHLVQTPGEGNSDTAFGYRFVTVVRRHAKHLCFRFHAGTITVWYGMVLLMCVDCCVLRCRFLRPGRVYCCFVFFMALVEPLVKELLRH